MYKTFRDNTYKPDKTRALVLWARQSTKVQNSVK